METYSFGLKATLEGSLVVSVTCLLRISCGALPKLDQDNSLMFGSFQYGYLYLPQTRFFWVFMLILLFIHMLD